MLKKMILNMNLKKMFIKNCENFSINLNVINSVTGPHGGGSGGSGSRHACMIAVFLLVRLLYLLIHFIRSSIQIYTNFCNACKSHKSHCDIFINYLLFVESASEINFLTLMLTLENDLFKKTSFFHYEATTVLTVQN